jgi:phosphatidylinositol alpha 1,6-mannosyltransferase
MAAGVPVIAAGAGGPAEILEHGRTGILYEPNDGAALAGCMRRLQDPALRERLGAAAREEVRRYEPTIVAADLQRIYAAVSATARARA